MNPADCPNGYPWPEFFEREDTPFFWHLVNAILQSQEPAQQETVQ